MKTQSLHVTKLMMLAAFAVLICSITHAQNTFPATGPVGIGTTSPNASSLLEIKSTSKGFLAPRMTKAQRDAIGAPAVGLLIYQTNSTPGFYYYAGSAWKAVTPVTNGWSLTGNAGTNPSTNFIGTTDARSLIFKVNNLRAGLIDYSTFNTGTRNTAFGQIALNSNTSGIENTATGYGALYTNQIGNNNAAFGKYALFNNNANDNTALGYNAMFFNSTGTKNTAIGSVALQNNTTSSNNTANGYAALYSNNGGSENTAVGVFSLFSNITSHDNTAIGYQALYSNTDNYNTAVGFRALFGNISGFNNTSIGIEADVSASNLVNSTAIGANAVVNASNKIRLGDGGITVVESNAGSWTVSDGRFKNNIKANVKGLEFIKLLRPVTYNFDTKKFQEFLIQNSPDSIKSKRMAAMNKDAMAKASSIVQTGFIAQEIAEAVKKSGYSFNGVHAPDNTTDNWSLSYEKLVVPLVKAVQELSAKNDGLQKQIDDLKAMIIAGSTNNTSLKSSAFTTLTDASLNQNNPNPFDKTTTISYTLPQKFTSAQILITDKSGKTVKQVNVSGTGKGTLNIDAATLASGAYNYSLVVDGKLIGTRQMLLAK